MAANSFEPHRLRQIRLSSRPDGNQGEPVNSLEVVQEHENFKSLLSQLMPREYWTDTIFEQSSPNPIVISDGHKRQLSELHSALTLAVTDVVERWWTDRTAGFPERMPLEAQEEDLLQWMESQESTVVRPFKECAGAWRPDFLLESHSECTQRNVMENFRICEINARFCWNGATPVTLGQKVLEHMGVGKNGYVGATDPEKVMHGLFQLFNPSRPLHLLKGEESGHCIHTVMKAARDALGIQTRFITPADLRLLNDASSKSGYRLCCRVPHDVDQVNIDGPTVFEHKGELWEEIDQVCLELHQRELRALGPEMLRQLSLKCFNDLRTVFLVHDKRMLGIVLQEIPSLVARGVLTMGQSEILRNGIAETILPGSPELEDLISECHQTPQRKDDYLLKPIRSGKGAGILFGTDLDELTWAAKLDSLRCPSITSGTTPYVVQRRIKQPSYDLLLHDVGKVRYPLVGTYHAAHGQFLGLGTWRFSAGDITAVTNGGAWCCSVMEGREQDAVHLDASMPVSKPWRWSVPSFVSVCLGFLSSLLVKGEVQRV